MNQITVNVAVLSAAGVPLFNISVPPVSDSASLASSLEAIKGLLAASIPATALVAAS